LQAEQYRVISSPIRHSIFQTAKILKTVKRFLPRNLEQRFAPRGAVRPGR
jgi:hypothetical protein